MFFGIPSFRFPVTQNPRELCCCIFQKKISAAAFQRGRAGNKSEAQAQPTFLLTGKAAATAPSFPHRRRGCGACRPWLSEQSPRGPWRRGAGGGSGERSCCCSSHRCSCCTAALPSRSRAFPTPPVRSFSSLPCSPPPAPVAACGFGNGEGRSLLHGFDFIVVFSGSSEQRVRSQSDVATTTNGRV
jgi:hypothetical protein